MTILATDPHDLDDLPDGSIIRAPGFVAEARTTGHGRVWATTTSRLLDSTAVITGGPVLVVDTPRTGARSRQADRELIDVIAASAELATFTAQRRRASDRLAAKIANAHTAGLPYQAIADALGVSRQRVAVIAQQAAS